MAQMVGQGTALPPDLGCEGQWIVEEVFFIYHPDDSQFLGGAAPRFTVAAVYNGRQCIGFDAAQVAAALGIETSTLLHANKTGALTFLGVADVPPTYGGTSAIAYGFQLGERRGSLTIEMDDRQGTA
jgi:hypothetical protein